MRDHNSNLELPTMTDPQSEQSVAPPVSRLGLLRIFMQESLQVIVPALALALTVHLFLAQATIVYGQSMEPNLSERQRLIIDKLSYRLHPPRRNDIVVLDMPDMSEMLVKRVIGLPGETIEIQNGVVYVNGTPLPEPFPHDLGFENRGPVTLGPLNYYVMGDNRDNSNDSRSFGPVKRESILGRVWLRYWPLDQLKNF
jgi:signal peptidase I